MGRIANDFDATPLTRSEIADYYRVRVPGLKQSGREWRGRCPVHRGEGDNFAVNSETGLAFCHSQCGRGWNLFQLEEELSGRPWKQCRDDVYNVLGRSSESLPKQNKKRPVASYDYTDATGKLVFQVVRYAPKTFSFRQPIEDAAGRISWRNDIKGIRKMLYRLPEVLGAETVLVTEGEKDADNLRRIDFVATCNPGGACDSPTKWLPAYTECLTGKRVILFPDNDDPGQRHAGFVGNAIRETVKELRLVRVPVGKDVSDWIAAGADRAAIEKAIANAVVLKSADEMKSPDELALPEIQTNDRSFRDVCAEALDSLRVFNDPPQIFVRASRLAAIEHSELGRPFIADLDEMKLRNYLAHSGDYFEVSKQGNRRQVYPPLDVSKNLLARNPGSWPFPVLGALVETPTLRFDGTILSQPGYDPASRLFLAPSNELGAVKVPFHPNARDTKAALHTIEDVIADFPFVDRASHANCLATILTCACRHLIPGPVPAALFDAAAAGTGKTLLAEVISLIITGRAAELNSPPGDGEEWRKLLTSLLIEAPFLVVLDNVAGVVDSPELCKVITSEAHRDRILGKSKSISLPVRCCWILTGNNLRVAGDMSRRCYLVRMDARCPEPAGRTGFRHGRIKEYVSSNRSKILAAVLTLARAWYAAGKPKSSVPLIGSFEVWTETIAGILAHAGVEGFLANREELLEQRDMQVVDWAAFLKAIHDTFASSEFSIAELWDRLSDRPPGSPLRSGDRSFTPTAHALRKAVRVTSSGSSIAKESLNRISGWLSLSAVENASGKFNFM
jgi:hypothetical protein